MTVIDSNTFKGSTSLESVVLPGTISKIDAGTFSGFANLLIEDLNLDNLTFLGNNAFKGTGIRKISNLGKITEVPISAFQECTVLTEIALSNIIVSIKDSCFRSCINLKTVIFPHSLSVIRDWGFYECTSLESIVLPDSITEIRIGAFAGCTSMTSVTILASAPPISDRDIFKNTNDCPIYVPAASVAAYKAATNWSAYASRIQAIDD